MRGAVHVDAAAVAAFVIRPAGTGAMPPRSTILLLGAIAALGSLATQLLVPALPSIASDLGIGIASAQLILGVFLIGLGGGQLVVGPLGDKIDRRTMLLLGLAVYALGSLAGSLAGSFGVLLAARLAQAIGSAAGLVTARVLLNSMVPPERAVAAQASLMAVVLISPALAPVIGGLLAEFIGWRAIMALLCVAALIAALVVFRAVPRSAEPDRVAGTPPLRHAYGRILANRRFFAATAAMAFGSAALYVFLGAMPFLLENAYHLSPRQTGLCLLLIASASIVGTRVVGMLQQRTEPLIMGGLLNLAAVLALVALAGNGPLELWLLLVPLAIVGLCAGIIGPSAIGHVLASEPGAEGAATSLAGALQMGASALFTWLLGSYAATSAWHLGLALLPLAAAAAMAAFAVRRVALPKM